MILVDTSVWIDHQRGRAPHLSELLDQDLVSIHPGVIGELACGSLADREEFLALLRNLPEVRSVGDDEVLFFISVHRIFGRGAGYMDMHLMAAATVNGIPFWTHDRRLAQIAADLNIAYSPTS
jgi:predicted nucleic acid-binding protein